MVKRNITVEELREALDYNPETGEFRWKERIDPRSGKLAGCTASSHGYRMIGVNNRVYLAHRLAWLYIHGEWPICQVDHINMDRADNKLSNLRLANHFENKWNRTKNKANKSGYKGIRFHKASGLWQARIMRNRKNFSIGYYKTIEEAAAAYADFIIKLNDGFSRT